MGRRKERKRWEEGERDDERKLWKEALSSLVHTRCAGVVSSGPGDLIPSKEDIKNIALITNY